MNIIDLGFTDSLAAYLKENNLSDFSVGRVTQEHRERYVVSDGDKEYDAEITGNLRFAASSRTDFPAVGDWVTMIVYDSDQAIIHKILPRKSVLERQAVGKPGEVQIISANIDAAFIVQAINHNFSINRLERYLTICNSAGIEPILVISKIDLCTEKEAEDVISNLARRERKIKCILLSNMTLQGLDQIVDFIQKRRTYCVIGSSGAGKSTLINNLFKKDILKTGQISLSTNKGRHVTDHRELFVLENGGIIIDTPGMREVGIADSTSGLEITFDDIVSLARKCRFKDCTHTKEAGCRVIAAVDNGEIDKNSYENYLKLQREKAHYESTIAEKRKKDKAFGKLLKNYHKDISKE
jgi:ribosome biogenesis GTPase / thiamine phosphate phosphatase